MKVTINLDINKLCQRIEDDLDKFATGIVESLSVSIEKGARRNFNNSRGLISSDFDFVNVARFVDSKYQQTIECSGDQVLFIEFGAGAQNKSRYTASEVVGWHGEHISWKYTERPNFGFKIKNNRLLEEAPRPAGIVELGTYGKGYGADDWWIRPSITGIPNKYIGESNVHIKDKYGNDTGRVRSDVVWTKGHPPMRALWRAVRSAEKNLRKMLGGK